MEIKQIIRRFIKRFVGDKTFEDSEDIFKKGLVNSLFAMQLVAFIEDEFDITIENDDLVLTNFKDVNSIADLIQRKSN